MILKKVCIALISILCLFPVFSQTLSATQKGQPASFNDINLVRLGPQEGILFDTFVIGDGAQPITSNRWITSFKMNKYETTYNLWYVVRVYAEQQGYTFINPGQGGAYGRRGKAPTKQNAFEPVTMICWYDAIVWCNALSEMLGKKPCYTYGGNILRDATDSAALDLADCAWDSDGYRLPTEAEWEYAARHTPAGYQKGNLASGQVNDLGLDDSSIPETDVAWMDANSNSTHIVGTAGTPFTPDAPPEPGSGRANSMGIFDMSGNVVEFCWDWLGEYTDVEPGKRAVGAKFGKERVARGGSWSPYTGFIYAGDRYGFDPNEMYNYMGFRFCTSK